MSASSCRPLLRWGSLYGLRPYASLLAQAWTGAGADHKADTRWVYEFKKRGRHAEEVRAAVEAVRIRAGCASIVAVPGSTPEPNRLQALFGVGIERLVAVPARKTQRDFAPSYASSYRIHAERIAGPRVLLVDDVCKTGDTLKHFASALTAAGFEVVALALGLAARLGPEIVPDGEPLAVQKIAVPDSPPPQDTPTTEAALLDRISALSELGMTVDEAARVLALSPEAFHALLAERPDARARWERGAAEARAQLKLALTKQALNGNVAAAKMLLDVSPAGSAAAPQAPKLLQLRPLAEVAAALGLTPRALQLWCDGKKATYQPPLPHELRRGREIWLSPAGAYEHLRAHGSRKLLAKLTPPTGYVDAAAETPAAPAPEAQAAAETDGNTELLALVKQIARELGKGQIRGPELLRSLTMAATLEERIKAQQAREQTSISLDEALAACTAVGQAYVAFVAGSSRAFAERLLAAIRGQLAVDLAANNSAAAEILERELYAQASEIVANVAAHVEAQRKGLQNLEGAA